MAGSDHPPQKQLLSLIRDFASEKSQGERRVVGLKKRVEELRLELNTSNLDLEEAKRFRETIEQDLKGYEVELALKNASIQALEARISLIQGEMTSVGSEVEVLKNEERASRDEFIRQMLELNDKIRGFQESIASKLLNENATGTAEETDLEIPDEVVTEVDFSETTEKEQEYLAEENLQKREYQTLLRKVSPMEATAKETNTLQDLTKYP
ncbi:hypothetical protein K2173_014267 [Erythroxylum novogranatense]|uniref:Uncharacterized protein n=1 Tax=Erythroxylum novogranatense TaxID=1862640 RepID=A0AAV8SDP4_9ROSI|nr:hypothetical protein K2173_014267 [Erythroxylum novogranatense]